MSKLEAVIADHIDDAGCTLWGRSFDVKSEEGKKQAVDWFAKNMRAVISRRAVRDHA